MQIETSVTYEYREGNIYWEIPFPYGSAEQVAAAIIERSGLQRTCTADEYRLEGSRLVCFLRPGQRLAIWLNAPLSAAISAYNNGGYAASRGSYAAASFAEANYATGAAPGAAVPAAQVATVGAARAAVIDEAEISGALGRIDEAACTATKALQNAADQLAAQAAAALEGKREAAALALADTADRVSQKIALESKAAGIYAAEAAGEAESAAEHAHAAAVAVADCAKASAAARQSLETAENARNAADASLAAAQSLLNETRRLAMGAYDAACVANASAVRCSVHHVRPGIAAVKNISEIHAASPGLFIVNPCLTHTPTPFFGVYPVSCPEDIRGEGVFFIGLPYPDGACPPPWQKPKPPAENLQNPGDGDDWLPCDHAHKSCACPPKPPLCGC